MAVLRLENETTYSEESEIASHLAPLKIQLHRWPVGDSPRLQSLLAQASLSKEEKTEVLTGLDGYFQQLQQKDGYKSRDLIVLHPDVPNLDGILSKFDRMHTHADDEVRYIIDGEGVFGFVLPDGSQMELTVQPEEYINVPAGTEHWFYLTPQRRIKALRYFTGTEGWVPQYTGTEIKMRQAVMA
ncbi:MAG: acireductone dioxygenase [Hormoscilla sp.]